jgi:uncharacterized membrane protein
MMAADLSRFFKLLLLGFSLIFTGMILLIIASVSAGTSNFGGAIVIWPIPIIFGAGENAWLIALVASILTIVCLLLLFPRKRQKQDARQEKKLMLFSLFSR